MKVLVACEYSGNVRDAFIKKGHEAMSCDLMDTDVAGPHYKGDVFDIINDGWDLMIAHPPCTFLCTSGARWLNDHRYPNRRKDREEAAEFFMKLYNSNIPKVCCENPVGYMTPYFRKPDQYVKPYEYGHPTTKKTGLWLKNLPKLASTDVVEGRENRVWKMPPSVDRWKERSRTYQGIAAAMAAQWGNL